MRGVNLVSQWLNTGGRTAQLAGNIGLSLASLLLAYSLLQSAPVADYGSFAFVLVLQAFGFSLLNALIGAPLLILQHQQPVQPAALKAFFWLVLALALLLAGVQALFLLAQGYSWQLALVFAAGSVMLMLRWYGRLRFQNMSPRWLVLSDGLFSIAVLVLLLLVWGWASITGLPLLTLEVSGWILLLATMLSMWPFISDFYLQWQSRTDWTLLRLGFRQQGRAALLGVMTVEISANLHSYLLVALAGSAAFAPVAAAMLFFRPLAVVQGSLLQSERPALARALTLPSLIGQQRVVAQLRNFQWLALGLCVGNGLLLVGCYLWFPSLLWPDLASFGQFTDVLLLVALITLLRSFRGPASALLQAANQFGPLATASVWSACLTLPLVLAGWYLAGVIGTLLGILAGEFLLSLMIHRQKSRLFAARSAAIFTHQA